MAQDPLVSRLSLWATVIAVATWLGASLANAPLDVLTPAPRRTLSGIGATEAAGRTMLPSSACWSCHDGSAGIPIRPEKSHPSAVPYGGRSTLRPVSSPSGYGSTIAADLLLEGRIECTSCHVPHEVDTTIPFRLRARQPRLCYACHDV